MHMDTFLRNEAGSRQGPATHARNMEEARKLCLHAHGSSKVLEQDCIDEMLSPQHQNNFRNYKS